MCIFQIVHSNKQPQTHATEFAKAIATGFAKVIDHTWMDVKYNDMKGLAKLVNMYLN